MGIGNKRNLQTEVKPVINYISDEFRSIIVEMYDAIRETPELCNAAAYLSAMTHMPSRQKPFEGLTLEESKKKLKQILLYNGFNESDLFEINNLVIKYRQQVQETVEKARAEGLSIKDYALKTISETVKSFSSKESVKVRNNEERSRVIYGIARPTKSRFGLSNRIWCYITLMDEIKGKIYFHLKAVDGSGRFAVLTKEYLDIPLFKKQPFILPFDIKYACQKDPSYMDGVLERGELE